MAKLLGVEDIGGRVQKEWLHTDGAGNDVITTETVQDVAPIIKATKQISDAQLGRRSWLRCEANIPVTLLEDLCKLAALDWGIQPYQAVAEVMRGETDRSQRLLKMLTQGRDYRKLQTEKDSPRFVKVEKPDGTSEL